MLLRVSENKNPALAPLSLDVAFAPCVASAKGWQPERLASLGVYPSDQAGSYSVPVASALERLRSRGVSNVKDVCVQVRLRLLHPGATADRVELALAAPQWQKEK
jgi:hypothetical protein